MTPWVDLDRLKDDLLTFLSVERRNVMSFGTTVNQTFEAYVFASTVKWYRQRKYDVTLNNPAGGNLVRLKFSTRGRPDNYTYATVSRKNKAICEVRHQLRVRSCHARSTTMDASFVLDVAVVKPHSATGLASSTPVDNTNLLTFAEAKHMSAFAELIAGFLGLVHEVANKRLRPRKSPWKRPRHPQPFLYVSGVLYPSAKAVVQTIADRRYDFRVYDKYTPLT